MFVAHRIEAGKSWLLFTFDEINANGGVLGKMIEPVVADGASDWPVFAEKAEQLIAKDGVSAVFGCWTSVSRKFALPVFEKYNNLLFYPVQYEGEEESPNIIYTAEAVGQQAIPAVDYLLAEGYKKFYRMSYNIFIFFPKVSRPHKSFVIKTSRQKRG